MLSFVEAFIEFFSRIDIHAESGQDCVSPSKNCVTL